MLWSLGTKVVDCSRPRVMGIVNVTPDSFFEESRLPSGVYHREEALDSLLESGPDIVDVGGQSTRPGSQRVGPDTELSRVVPVIEQIRNQAPGLPITIDTYHLQVAREALAAGADGINDISAWAYDPAMVDLVAQTGCGYVLMHMQGTPESMQADPSYQDCAAEVKGFLSGKLEHLLAAGVKPGQVVLDPGIGFGKRLEDNLDLINKATALAELGRPLLYGVSRKSFIGKLTGEKDALGRLPGTLGVTWQLLNNGVMLHRVHDIRETRQIFATWQGIFQK